jgi:hypothetical protein
MDNKKIIIVQGEYYEEEECQIGDYKDAFNKLEVKMNPNKYRDEYAFTKLCNAIMGSNNKD